MIPTMLAMVPGLIGDYKKGIQMVAWSFFPGKKEIFLYQQYYSKAHCLFI